MGEGEGRVLRQPAHVIVSKRTVFCSGRLLWFGLVVDLGPCSVGVDGDGVVGVADGDGFFGVVVGVGCYD